MIKWVILNNRFIFSLKTIKLQAMRLCHFNFLLKTFSNQNYFICTRNSNLHTRDLKQSIFKYNNSYGKRLAVQLSGPYKEKPDRSSANQITRFGGKPGREKIIMKYYKHFAKHACDFSFILYFSDRVISYTTF